MDGLVEELSRDLFEGNRSKVEARLKGQASGGQEFWLLAASTEDYDTRQELLQRVASFRTQPYARLAEDILEREARYAAEMAQLPGWQQWLLSRRRLLVGLALAIVMICALVLVGGAILGI